jgi:protein phosphatase
MGGPGGSVASRMATTWVHDELTELWMHAGDQTPTRFATFMRHAVERANERLHQHSADDNDLRGMGSTATVVGVLGGYLYLAQVGDSRAYLVRDSAAIQLTRDQSVVQALIDAGALSEDEAEMSAHSTTILQALGTAPQVSVDMTWQEARRGDVLVLCSDGLFRVVRREEIGEITAMMQDPADACDTLIALANQRGGPDNVTVVVVRLDGDGLDSPTSSEVVGRNVLSLPQN